MAFLKKSMSQDAIDSYCDTWAFLFLSLLAVTFLFLPLAPSMTLTAPSPSQRSGSPKDKVEINKEPLLRYKSVCWTPPQFTYSHTAYVESVCSSTINSLVQGKEVTNAGIYSPLWDNGAGPPSSVFTKEDFRMTPRGGQDQTSAQINNKRRIKAEVHQHEKESFLSGITDLIRYKAPLLLLVFALCLRLPHAIWAVLSTCCGCMNVDQTLSAAQRMGSVDDAAGDCKIRRDLSIILKNSTKKSTSLLYLLMKLLMIVVLIVGFKVNHDMVMEIDRLENERSDLLVMEEDTVSPVKKASLNGGTNSSTENGHSLTPPFDGRVLLCDFKIRRLQNIQAFTVQCFFTVDQNGGGTTSGKASPKSTETMQSQKNEPDYEKILLTYKCVFVIVLSLLIVLALLSICSLVIWLAKLFVPSCRSCMVLKGDEATDVVFIVAMAWINASSGVAMELAKCTAISDKRTSDGDEFELS